MEELKIAICDDEKIQTEMLVNYIHDMKLDYNYNLITTNEPENLISILDEEKIDIAFLDIEMDRINGIDVGKEIRSRYKDCIIIFVTGFRDYALDAFQIKAMDYLIKPVNEEKFRTLMYDVIERYLMVRDGMGRNYFTIEDQDRFVRLDYDVIYYFEKVQRKVRVHTRNNSYDFYGTLKEVKKYLDMGEYFCQCHQGYIVNTHKIVEMRKDKIVIDDLNIEIPVSRRYRVQIVDAFEDVLFKAK